MRKTLVNVDGSNLLAELGKQPQFDVNIRAVEHDHNAIEIGKFVFRHAISNSFLDIDVYRTLWFASVSGDEKKRLAVREKLRDLNLDPNIFPSRGGREKQVDAAIVRELLIGAQAKAFEACILVAGDRDYLDALRDVKRFGIVSYVCFFKSSTDDDLRIEADRFLPITAGLSQGDAPLLANLIGKYGRRSTKP